MSAALAMWTGECVSLYFIYRSRARGKRKPATMTVAKVDQAEKAVFVPFWISIFPPLFNTCSRKYLEAIHKADEYKTRSRGKGMWVERKFPVFVEWTCVHTSSKVFRIIAPIWKSSGSWRVVHGYIVAYRWKGSDGLVILMCSMVNGTKIKRSLHFFFTVIAKMVYPPQNYSVTKAN